MRARVTLWSLNDTMHKRCSPRLIHTRAGETHLECIGLAYSFRGAKYEDNIRDNISDGIKKRILRARDYARGAVVVVSVYLTNVAGVSNLLLGDFNARIMQIEAYRPCISHSRAPARELL